MLMDRIQTIESFVRIAHAGSYTKAAQQLGVSRALLLAPHHRIRGAARRAAAKSLDAQR
jgi:DNA-binding transcriptional regulator YdaS (Cro superfamily)